MVPHKTSDPILLPPDQALYCNPQPPQSIFLRSTTTSRDITITMSTLKTPTNLIFYVLPSLQQDLNDLTAEREELLADYDLLSHNKRDLTDAEYSNHRSKVINAVEKMLREKNEEILWLKQRVDDCKRVVRLSIGASSPTQ
jgi:predicted RNase H-like nuclease (RuvC/YqgF family)